MSWLITPFAAAAARSGTYEVYIDVEQARDAADSRFAGGADGLLRRDAVGGVDVVEGPGVVHLARLHAMAGEPRDVGERGALRGEQQHVGAT